MVAVSNLFEVEAAGFGAFFRSDHYLAMGEPPRAGIGSTDAWITLAGLARDTNRIRLGTLLTAATFRHPGPLAISVAEVDAMSGGRVELGLGAGWYEEEHAAYGIPFPSLGERFERLEEQFAIITGLWATDVGATFDFQGKHYSLSDCPALPKPVQAPRPPIIVGGHGRRITPRLAAALRTGPVVIAEGRLALRAGPARLLPGQPGRHGGRLRGRGLGDGWGDVQRGERVLLHQRRWRCASAAGRRQRRPRASSTCGGRGPRAGASPPAHMRGSWRIVILRLDQVNE